MAEWSEPLRARRDELGWTQMRAALEIRIAAARAGQPDLPVDGNAVSRWERGIRPSRFYARWIAEAYGATVEGLGLNPPVTPRPVGAGQGAIGTLLIRSHKFVPVYCSPPALDIVARRPPSTAEYQAAAGSDCASSLTAHAYPFGIVVLHVREEAEFPGVAWLAAWRKATYHHAREAIDRLLAAVPGASPTEYVFSVFDVLAHPWPAGRPLRAGVRLVSMPSVLLSRSDRWDVPQDEILRGQVLEGRLIAQGFEHAEIREFGIAGISLGFASWSAVAYHAMEPEQRLAAARLVEIELLTQALWAYCSRLASDRRPLEDYPAFRGEELQAYAGRLVAPSQPMEATDECLAREAIVETSRLRAMLEQAERCLR